MTSGYMKKYLLVILLLLLIILAVAAFIYEPVEEEREFRGTFVTEWRIYGHLHQTDEKSEYSWAAAYFS